MAAKWYDIVQEIITTISAHDLSKYSLSVADKKAELSGMDADALQKARNTEGLVVENAGPENHDKVVEEVLHAWCTSTHSDAHAANCLRNDFRADCVATVMRLLHHALPRHAGATGDVGEVSKNDSGAADDDGAKMSLVRWKADLKAAPENSTVCDVKTVIAKVQAHLCDVMRATFNTPQACDELLHLEDFDDLSAKKNKA